MSDVHIERDKENGKIQTMEHFHRPYGASESLKAKGNVTPKELAQDYLKEILPLLEIDENMIKGSEKKLDENKLTIDQKPENKLELQSEKPSMGTTVVTYKQTYMGIPVVDGGLSVYVNNDPMQITRSQNSIHYDIKVKEPNSDAKFMPNSITRDTLVNMLKFSNPVKGNNEPQIHDKKLVIYKYDPILRIDHKIEENDDFGTSVLQSMVIPDISPTILPNQYYFVTEIIFSFTLTKWSEPITWRARIEVETGSLLSLFALVDFADGLVYLLDPLRITGDTSIRPSSSGNVLDSLRTTVTLQGIRSTNPGNIVELKGDLIELVDVSNPSISPPLEPFPGSFNYSVLTDNFAAVNAYYHSHYVFQMAKDMGFPFVRTRFPVPVDHRAIIGDNCNNGNCVNAMAPQAPNGGSWGFRFALAELNTSFGIANCFDIVLHEFCHSLLEESVNHPNFRFVHNCGDALAAIMCDPDSKNRDRGRTFYCINRRHDRKVTEGWAWGGIHDTGFREGHGGYRSEEILSTSMFRIYLAIGGDSNSKDIKKKASRYMTYLILKTISSLDPNTRARNVREFVSLLINSDFTTNQFEQFFGGHMGKVIRWAFEKQGLFQMPGSPSPVSSEGEPPETDVYIDDGRNGEYGYQNQLNDTKDICNRNMSDGIFEHQDPIPHQENFVYVKVKNRGYANATGITVKIFNSNLVTDIFPDDYLSMDPPKITLNHELVSKGEITVGPFKWRPRNEDKKILVVVSANGDLSNADVLPGSFPANYLVSFDNNNAQRSV